MPPADCSLEDYFSAAEDMIGNTCQFNVTGHPVINIPCGMEDDLPIGLSLVGRHFDEATIISAAEAFEKIGDWKTM